MMLCSLALFEKINQQLGFLCSSSIFLAMGRRLMRIFWSGRRRWKVVDPPSHGSGRQWRKFDSGSPSMCVLWVGGRANGVELGFLAPGQGGGILLSAVAAQQRGLCHGN